MKVDLPVKVGSNRFRSVFRRSGGKTILHAGFRIRDAQKLGSDPKRVFRSARAVFEMRVLVAALVFVTAFAFPAMAQLMLHNGPDAAPAEGGGEPAPAGSDAAQEAQKAKPIPMKPPADESVVGQALLRDGAVGAIALSRQGKDLEVAKLSLEGEEISKPGEPCHVEINAGLPITARFDGRPVGLSRYQVDLQACPFSFDVLEGAILIPKGHACDFTAADCHVDPAGLWGPQGNTISQTRAHDMEQARLHIETDMRANFRVLLSHAGKDKVSIKRIAGEQAGFSSERETLCHSYALESVHGFCALEITRARVLALLAQLGAISNKQDEVKPPPAKKKPKPPSVAAEPAPAPPQ
jgi:hypothetical protein